MLDRYETAQKAADDLRRWLEQCNGVGRTAGDQLLLEQIPKYVPRGLRPYGKEDASYFLSLLPGGRDGRGLPDPIAVWKDRIEAQDDSGSFTVGVLYGPSGCGKSSLVRAGLLPCLDPRIQTVVLDASARGTEQNLQNLLRQVHPDLEASSLAEAFAELRRREPSLEGKKTLVVIDQFEQWLYANMSDANGELARALRQCDGKQVQALLLVRADFWMAIDRFLKVLEIPMTDKNSMSVELFEQAHARKMLIAMGRAFDKLAWGPIEPGSDAHAFVDQAVDNLSENGEVVPVRLVLFAEMMRRRPWTLETLEALGGVEGVGVKFLEESFSGQSAPPAHRAHAQAAQSVLSALLPGPASPIASRSRTSGELIEASGYKDEPSEFNDLIRILDSELRLVTPTDPSAFSEARGKDSAEESYQLTHDYLVPSIRQWLAGKKTETRKGRAETRLELITEHWMVRPEARLLPSFLEWLGILYNTDKRIWTPNQRRMMRSASRRYALRIALGACLAFVLAAIGLYSAEFLAERTIVRQAINADYRELPAILKAYESRAGLDAGELESVEVDPSASSRKREIATIMLFQLRPSARRAETLRNRIKEAEPEELAVLTLSLVKHREFADPKSIASSLERPDLDGGARLRVACVLAGVEPKTVNWDKQSRPIVEALLDQDPRSLPIWIEMLSPVFGELQTDLEIAAESKTAQPSRRSAAGVSLAEALGRRADATGLAKLVVHSEPEAFLPLFQAFRKLDSPGALAAILDSALAAATNANSATSNPEVFAHRQANAAVAFLLLEFPQRLTRQLDHKPDPRVRTILIERLAEPYIKPSALAVLIRDPSLSPAAQGAPPGFRGDEGARP